MKRRGRRVAIWVTSMSAIVLGVATWQGWPHIQFWWRFESLGLNAKGYPEYRHRLTGIIFVRLPGGTFNTGSPEGEPCRNEDEGPIYEVTLCPYLVGEFEVTQGQWQSVMGNAPSHFDGTRDFHGNAVAQPVDRCRLPVEQVSWDDIQEFEEKTGLKLPTEAQWEYACRGGTETAFSFGSGESCTDWANVRCPEFDTHMWYCANSEDRPHEVGLKQANPFGLHDMHGNVWEWCENLYDSYATPDAGGWPSPFTLPSEFRVLRGGSWYFSAEMSRSAYRFWENPGACGIDRGFRAAYWPLP